MTSKKCFKCERVLPLSEFYKHSQMADGHLNKCKACTKKDVRSHYDRTLDERKAYEQERGKRPERKAAQRDYSRRRRELHPEAVRASQRAYVEKNNEKVQAAKKAYAEKHPEKVLAAKRAYAKKNHEKVRESQRSLVKRQFEADPDGYREKRREYARLAKEKDPEEYREKHRQYLLRRVEKRRANMAVGNAIRDGRLKKRPCEVCGAKRGIHAHHDDYSKPLDVRWLCIRHHHEAHGHVIVTAKDYSSGE